MRQPVGYEYKLTPINGKNYIVSFTEKPLNRNPELENNPIPLPGMRVDGWPRDEYGNLQFTMVEQGGTLVIIHDPQTPSEHKEALTNFNKSKLFKIIKAQNSEIIALRNLVGGSPTAPFTKLQNVMTKIQNGF